MRVFFSAVKKPAVLDFFVEHGARSFLFSYEDKKVINQIKYLAEKPEDLTILVDSGAFSAWNRGAIIKREEYLRFIEQVKRIDSRHTIYFINLDVIPHTKGEGKPTKDQVKAACEKGLDNYRYFKDNGHFTLHTFHQFEDFYYLDVIRHECNGLDYIGISPANDQTMAARNKWLSDVFYRIKDTTRTHVLGLTSRPAMERFPAYSADSSTWLNPGKFGELFNYSTLEILRLAYKPEDLTRCNIGYHDPKMESNTSFFFYLRLERYITHLWERRGVAWK